MVMSGEDERSRDPSSGGESFAEDASGGMPDAAKEQVPNGTANVSEPASAEHLAEAGGEKSEAAPALEVSTVNDHADVRHNESVLAESCRHTRRSFVVAAAAAAAGYGMYQWIEDARPDEMQPEGFRRAFELNAALSRKVFDERALAPTYKVSESRDLRVNGVYGLKMALAPESYRLQVVGSNNAAAHARYSPDVTAWQYQYLDAKTMESQGHDTKVPPPSAKTAEKMAPATMVEREMKNEERSGRMPRGLEEAGKSRSTLPAGTPGLLLTMDDILQLPRHELVTQFKCIEGWSEIVHWAGVKMADFLDAYPPKMIDGKEPRYVYMETPNGDYYTGYDMDVCRHPQTLLVTEMMGDPLTQYHGAPLRLHMPTKYGYKQIKRIGLILYTNTKPDDYWTKLGYDWYAGL
ncbi:MAG TPA: molybdopterin-dependent oxidoreductase [Acidobacteriaceae bacterium]|nr:molybdopterin-dependent oxidoreductase [Acidobacteriaceae bacterium]